MRLLTRTMLTAGSAAALGVTAYRLVASRRSAGSGKDRRRTHTLTVFRFPDEVTGNLPEPLAALGDSVDIDLRPAPGGRGTEIHVRPLDDSVSAGQIRAALRTGRSLLEVGEVLQPARPTSEPTLLNRPLRAATRHGREGGLL